MSWIHWLTSIELLFLRKNIEMMIGEPIKAKIGFIGNSEP